MTGAGFVHSGMLRFHRLRGEFVEVVAVWRGRGAGAFYLAYFVNLLADPTAKHLDSYTVGHRPARNPETGLVWNIEDPQMLGALFADMMSFISASVLPFFETASLRWFADEIERRGSMFNLCRSLVLGMLGESEQAAELLEKDLRLLRTKSDFYSAEKIRTHSSLVERLHSALKRPHDFEALVSEWRKENLRAIQSATS